jgi:alpha-galactosidase
MGFNNWARFMCNLNESLFVETANAMASKGLLAAGYNNINLDDCWSTKERSHTGELQWNTTLFPHGMPWLGDYLHTRGFNFGIYTNAGNMTCGGYPGSQDHEATDAQTFASWGVDYLKVDGCNMDLQHGRSYYQEFEHRYKLWHSVIHSLTTKPFIFSQSAPAYFSPNFHEDKNNTDWYRTMAYIRTNGELARHSDDVKVYGNNPTNTFEPGGHWESIMNNYDKQVRLARYQQGCGFYNDPDFLIPDWPDLTLDEKKSHFALWSSFSAPLIISAYVPDLKDEDVSYLTNKGIIAVDQDALCEQATLVSTDGYFDVLTKGLANGERLLTVLNRGDRDNETYIPFERLGIEPDQTYFLNDTWTKTLTTVRRGGWTVRLRSHQTGIWRIQSLQLPIEHTPTGMIFNTFSMKCLTARGRGEVVFSTCRGLDEQVWSVSADGAVRPLSEEDMCLDVDETVRDGAVLGLERCGKRDKSQEWSYLIDGNLLNVGKGLCLEEGRNHVAMAKKCRIASDSQVVALPGGVKLGTWPTSINANQ